MKLLLILSGVIFVAVLFTTCAPEPAKKSASKTEALRTLREADRQWSLSAPDLEKFMSFMADDVVWLLCSHTPMKGKNEVRSYYEPLFKRPGLSASWMPDRIDVSDAGDMGYVFGTYKASYQDSLSHRVEKNGYYATVWKKQSSGDWKVMLEADY